MCVFLVIVFVEQPSLLVEDDEVELLSNFIMFLSISSAVFNFFSYLAKNKEFFVAKSEIFSELNSQEIFLCFFSSAFMFAHPNIFIESKETNGFLAALCYLKIIPIYMYLAKITKYYGFRLIFIFNVDLQGYFRSMVISLKSQI